MVTLVTNARGPVAAGRLPVAPDLAVAAGALVVLSWLLAAGAPTVLVLGLAAAPLFLALGYPFSAGILVAALVLRPIVDGAGVFELTAGIGLGLIALAVLLSFHDIRAMVLLLAAAVPIVIATVVGQSRWGDDAVEEGLRLFSIIAVAAIALVMPWNVTRVKAARVIQLAGVVPAVVALFQAATGTGTPIGDVIRSSGTLAQANTAAFFFGVCGLACLVLVAEGGRRRLDLAAVGLFAAAVVTTGSIGGMTSFVVLALAYLVFVYGTFSIPVAAGVGSTAIALVSVYLSPLGRKRLAEFTAPSGPVEADNSLTWRFEAWGKILDAWEQRPVLGQGLGATKEGGILEFNIAHNEYLWILSEMGLVGLIVAIAAVAAYLAWLGRYKRHGASRYNLALAGALLIGLSVDSAVDNPLHVSPTMYAVAFLFAIAWRCSSEERSAERSVSPARSSPPAASEEVTAPALARAATRASRPETERVLAAAHAG